MYFTKDIKSKLEVGGFYKEDIHINERRNMGVSKGNKNYHVNSKHDLKNIKYYLVLTIKIWYN